jgi:hypothetical protein
MTHIFSLWLKPPTMQLGLNLKLDQTRMVWQGLKESRL